MSAKHKLSKTDKENWVVNLKRFIAPVAILYLVQVTATIGLEGHLINLVDFVPNAYTQGAIVLYVLNGALDIFTKWKNVS